MELLKKLNHLVRSLMSILIVYLLFFGNSQANATEACVSILDLLGSKIEHQRLSHDLLEKYGFLLQEDGLLVDKYTNLRMGFVERRNASYLYRWSTTHSYQESTISKGNVGAVWVSTHPTSSMIFGSYLMVFKTKGDMNILNISALSKEEHKESNWNIDLLKRFKSIGIDGYRSGHRSWIGMFSSQHLTIESGNINDPQLILELQKKDKRFFDNIKKSRLLKQMPSEQLRKLMVN